MKQTKALLGLIGNLLFLLHGHAQTVARLSIGDIVPEVGFRSFLHKPLATKSIAGLKGKLVILDFWTTDCGACIKSMPKMEKLQEKFADQLQILLVTPDSHEHVVKLFSKLKRKMPDLPMITDDKTFENLFPYRTVPHHVWLDGQGKVKYITNGWNATEENIATVLSGKNIMVEEKVESTEFDSNKPLVGNDQLIKNLLSYSCFMSRNEESGSAFTKWILDTAGRKTGLTLYNQTLLGLYQTAFSKTLFGGKKFGFRSKVLLLVKEPERFDLPSEPQAIDAWIGKNLYCYEAKTILPDEADFFTNLQQDLSRNFPYSARIEEREVDCLALVGENLDSSLRSRSLIIKRDMASDSFTLRNLPIDDFINTLNYSNLGSPFFFVNDTHYPYNVDLTIKAELNNIPDVSKSLKPYHLWFVRKKCKMEVLVVSDKANESR